MRLIALKLAYLVLALLSVAIGMTVVALAIILLNISALNADHPEESLLVCTAIGGVPALLLFQRFWRRFDERG